MKFFFIYLSFCITLFYSCELDYTMGSESGSEEKYPDIRMTGVSRVEIKGDKIFFVESGVTEIYYKSGETRFEDVSFEEIDEKMETVRKGKAGVVVQYNNDDILLENSIDVEDMESDSSVKAGELFWDNSERVLKNDSGDEVSINWEGGNMINGYGFRADFTKNEIKFSGSVNGNLVVSE